MLIYITNVFIKKSQVDIYAIEGFLFHFANATFRSDKCVIGVMTFKHCMGFKCKYKSEL